MEVRMFQNKSTMNYRWVIRLKLLLLKSRDSSVRWPEGTNWLRFKISNRRMMYSATTKLPCLTYGSTQRGSGFLYYGISFVGPRLSAWNGLQLRSRNDRWSRGIFIPSRHEDWKPVVERGPQFSGSTFRTEPGVSRCQTHSTSYRRGVYRVSPRYSDSWEVTIGQIRRKVNINVVTY
jgi:hypothetical protein